MNFGRVDKSLKKERKKGEVGERGGNPQNERTG